MKTYEIIEDYYCDRFISHRLNIKPVSTRIHIDQHKFQISVSSIRKVVYLISILELTIEDMIYLRLTFPDIAVKEIP